MIKRWTAPAVVVLALTVLAPAARRRPTQDRVRLPGDLR
jgi:hypothetical protein